MISTNCYIKEKVRNIAYNKIKTLIFEEDGIIYGGMVRDELISEYYKKHYNNNTKNIKKSPNFDKNKFWDTKFNNETAYRTLLAENIDVSFKNLKKTHSFINKILNSEELNKCELTTFLAPPYMPQIKIIKKLKISLVIDKIPFINKGEMIYIDINITVPINDGFTPPFNNVDMLCNAFIMTKEGKKLSNNTGTAIDKFSEYERIETAAKIIKDMIEFKTYLCLNPSFYNKNYCITYNNQCMNIIKKMHTKTFPWIILNMPFESYIISINKDINCCICYNILEKNERICNTTYSLKNKKFKVPPVHYNCMMKYLISQINDTSKLYNRYNQIDIEQFIINNNESLVFKCPYRNEIDFKNCRNIINKIYKY